MLDVTDASFETDVLDASVDTPVVVDLWAPWCGPCRSLGPTLDAAITAKSGRVVGVKVNVDENPAVSQAFNVQSIPAVYALKNRKVVDGFVGARGAADIDAFLDKLLAEHGSSGDGSVGEDDEPVAAEPAREVPDDIENTLEALLARVASDDEARQEFVDLLDVLGPDDPRTAPWRRRLTTALY